MTDDFDEEDENPKDFPALMPFYDFRFASEVNGFPYKFFASNGYEDFVKNTVLNEYFNMRRAFIKGDVMGKFEKISHKIKGLLSLYTPFLYDAFSKLNTAAKRNDSTVEDLYIETIVKVELFFAKIIELSRQTKNPVKKENIQKFLEKNEDFEAAEKDIIKNKLAQKRKGKINFYLKFFIEIFAPTYDPWLGLVNIFEAKEKEIKLLRAKNLEKTQSTSMDNKNPSINSNINGGIAKSFENKNSGSILFSQNGKDGKDFKDDNKENLEKSFSIGGFGCCGKEFNAINKLSFCLEFGECFALLGVNGAGKTTTFKCLTREILPTCGNIYINGQEISKNYNKIRNLIGYCPQFDAIFDFMTVKENLDFYANIKGIAKDKKETIINNLIDDMNLTNFANVVAGTLSGGNKRKLSVAVSVLGNPPIIFLDEPSTGIDPEARRIMWGAINKITKKKTSSVILTTHSMEEAETLCRRMGIMFRGQFKCIGNSQTIKDKYGYGFEVNMKIKSVPEYALNNYYELSGLKKGN